MNSKLNIVMLIENNPLINLNKDYENNLITKIKKNFTEDEGKLFVTSFYNYLNYNSINEFVIDLENIWKWIGFSRKDHAKILFIKHFVLNIDYKILLPQPREQDSHGGKNKEQILMTIKY
jgi:hypothetical protein